MRDLGHGSRLAELALQKCFQWFGIVRPVALEHGIFQLEVETKTLPYLPA